MGGETFVLQEEHIELLRAMYVYWGEGYDGAPAVDTKRPYGNSYVLRDLAKLLGVTLPEDDPESSPDAERLFRLHRETETALQIALVTGAFAPGVYQKTDTYNQRSWRRIK